MEYEFLSKFEQDPDRKVDFVFVLSLLKEIGTESFNLRLDCFVRVFYTSSDVNYSEVRSVWGWFMHMFNHIEYLNSLDQWLLASANLVCFADDLDEIQDFLIERAND